MFLLLFSCSTLFGQQGEKKLRALQRENDSLRLELLKCQSGAMQGLTKLLESPTFEENPRVNRAEWQAKWLPEIKEKSGEKHAIALRVIASTDAFLAYCNQIKADLTQRSGGTDPATGQAIGVRDKKIAGQYFLEEKQGAALRARIEAERAEYLKIVGENAPFAQKIILQIEGLPSGTSAKTWEEFKFKEMPLMAVFPILGKIQSDAQASELAVLQFLGQ